MSHMLEVENLETVFHGDLGPVQSIDQVSFYVDAGETLCIVGESGCGKSVTALSLLGLLARNGQVTNGSVYYQGENLLALDRKQLDFLRGNEISMIFQDAMTSLNPIFTIGSQMMEPIRTHLAMNIKEAHQHALELLTRVGLPEADDVMRRYPHMLSGGMRQRAMIAMALACKPKLLIADEPTTALDVTIQAQIIALLKELRAVYGMAMILITHDLGLVAEMADRVLVMYAGQVVEQADVFSLFEHPRHPYTRALLAAVPTLEDERDTRLVSIQGKVPERYQNIRGCRFWDRCPHAQEACRAPQALLSVHDGHTVRCCRALTLWDEVSSAEL